MAGYFKIVFLSLYFSLEICAQSGQIKFEHIGLEEGLSATTVMTILQDSRGFLWIGTHDGLNRYDGYSFTIFKNDPLDSTSLSGNRVRSICEDKNGNLWVGTWGSGLNKFDREKEKFIRYYHIPNDPKSLSSNEIMSVYITAGNHLWVATQDGLNRFDEDKNQFVHYMHSPTDPTSISDSSNSVNCILEDNEGNLWIGTSNGLNKFDRKTEKFTQYFNDPSNPQSISNNRIVCIKEGKNGFLWIGTFGGGLNKFDPKTQQFTRYTANKNDPFSISSNIIYSICEDSYGELWIGTYQNGLNRFDRKKNRFIHYIPDPNNPFSLSDTGIFALCEDRSGILWIGTWTSGINKYDRAKKVFEHFYNIANNPASINNDRIRSFCQDNYGSIWVGTEGGGLNKLNRDKNEFTHFINIPGNTSSLSNNVVYSICKDNLNNLWIGTDGGGLNKFNLNTKKFTHYKHNPDDPYSITSDQVSLVYVEKSGAIWVATPESGIQLFDQHKGSFTRFLHNPDNPNSIASEMVYSIYEDRHGAIWIGTYGGGLCKYDKKIKQFIHYKNIPGNSTSLSNNVVSAIYEDKSGVLWAGTESGLNKFDNVNEKFSSFKKEDGLPDDMIHGILEDDHGNLWMSTNKGISRFNPQDSTFKNYNARDGLQGNEFNSWSYYQCNNGEMLFGGNNGFNLFHPDSIKDNPTIPSIVITEFQLLHNKVNVGFNKFINRTILKKSITETKEIELNYDDNVISFEFAALDFRSPAKNRYAHILEGFDEDWTYTNADRRFATYTNLDPGEYTFKVKGSNNDGIWNEEGIALKIIINPPWWLTWLAFLLYALLLLLIFYTSTRFYLNRQRLKHQLELEHEHSEKLQEVDKMKSRFFTNISHEFRTPLTLIVGPSDKIIKDSSKEEIKKQAGIIKKNANRLLTLINQLLDLSKLEAGRIELETSYSNIVTFVKGIAMSFEALAENKDITLKVRTSNDEIKLYFDKEKMEKVLTNLLSNAFKFTSEGGKITVGISKTENDEAQIKVKDNGRGIPESELPKLFDRFYQVDSSRTREYEGTGIGLALSKELVELHMGSIKVESKIGKWTEFIITLPLGKNHLLPEEIKKESEVAQEKKTLIENEDAMTCLPHEKPFSEDFDKDKTIILVVEDNMDVREFIKDTLENNYYIEEATNGEQGLRKAEKIVPDLIVSDIMMPKMDGNELTRRLKNDERTSHIPVILLTAKCEQESKIEGLETGADAYLTKPFDINELQIRIKNLINLRKKLQLKFTQGKMISLKPEDKKLTVLDEKFMIRAMEVIEKNITREEFSIDEFGEGVGMSRMQLHRKIKALTGKTTTHYIRTVKMNKAKEMIEENKTTIAEIAYSLGFSSPAYFTRCFKDEYGYPPSEQVD